jgi:DNA replication ATP-dependent helicase Dna2
VPAVLGPLLLAKSFVLVGDHYQLSPLVVDARAQEQGLGRSLFRILCEAHPQVGARVQGSGGVCALLGKA